MAGRGAYRCECHLQAVRAQQGKVHSAAYGLAVDWHEGFGPTYLLLANVHGVGRDRAAVGTAWWACYRYSRPCRSGWIVHGALAPAVCPGRARSCCVADGPNC